VAPRATEASGPSGLSFWRRLWYSLLGGACYRQLAAERRGAYAVFLVVAVVTALTVAAASGLTVRRSLREIIALWPEVPAFSIKDGALRLASGATAPVRVVRGAVAVVLEPGAARTDPLGDARTGLAITAKLLILRTGSRGGGDHDIALSALGSATVTKPTLGRLLTALASTGVWLGVAVDVVYLVLRDFLRAAIVAWMAWVAVRLLGRNAGGAEAWRVGLAAWSLPMIAEAVGVVVPVPAWGLWLVAAVYAVIGLMPASAPL
jgi:hypothetical protein